MEKQNHCFIKHRFGKEKSRGCVIFRTHAEPVYLIKKSAPPVKTSSISRSSIALYLNLLDKLFLDWKVAAWPETGANEAALGLKPFGAHG